MIGSPNPLRSNFIMDTKAAASEECQDAMVSAAIEKGIALMAKENHDSTAYLIRSSL